MTQEPHPIGFEPPGRTPDAGAALPTATSPWTRPRALLAGGAARLRAVDRVTWIVLAITTAALLMRLWDLGARALHHDESQHAAFSYYFASGDGYRHDPLLHGPLNFHLIALAFKLLGDSDFTARLPHALAGTALVASPLLLRRRLGGVGAVAAAVFLALSPSLLYYSRFAREDILIALFTVMIFAALWRYREDGRLRWLLLLSAGLALSFATKESVYLTAAVVLLYLDAALAHALFWSRPSSAGASRRAQLAAAAWLLPSAWLFAVGWRPLARLRARLGLVARPREADLLIVTGTLVTPPLAAVARIPLERAGLTLAGDRGIAIAASIVVVLLLATAAVGLQWRWRRWLACAALFYAITLPLYATLGSHPQGIGGLFWNSLDYWLDQQGVRRGNGDVGFYYFMMVPLYESLILLPGLLGGLWLVLRRRDPFAALLLWWFVGSFAALSVAGEKMPWLTVHLALPLALLAAYVAQRAARPALAHVRSGTGSMLAWAGGGLALAVLGLALAYTVRTDIGLNVQHPDTPVEPLIYVQTTPDVPRIAAQMRAWLDIGSAQRVLIDDTDGTGIAWPWAWYLRHEPLTYALPGEVASGTFVDGTIVIAPRGTAPQLPDRAARFGTVVNYRHRWWFPEEGYRATSFRSLWDGLRDGSLLRRWARFAVHRIDPQAVASLDGEVLFPR